jgi:hypothetical protein
MAEIAAEAFETWEALILSGQIPQEDVPNLLSDNPAFAAWYGGRLETRR